MSSVTCLLPSVTWILSAPQSRILPHRAESIRVLRLPQNGVGVSLLSQTAVLCHQIGAATRVCTFSFFCQLSRPVAFVQQRRT